VNKTAIAGTSRKAITWCGPYALATVAGLTYDEVYEKMLRAYNKKRYTKVKHITGVTNSLMERVSKICRCTFKFERVTKRTLNQTMDHLDPNRIYIVLVTGHYIVVDTRDWTMIDNQNMDWVPIKESAHRLKRVRSVAEVKNHKVP